MMHTEIKPSFMIDGDISCYHIPKERVSRTIDIRSKLSKYLSSETFGHSVILTCVKKKKKVHVFYGIFFLLRRL